MTPTRHWKRILALGCSHGVHADPVALDAVLRFRESYKPHVVIHLGDFIDSAAFRAGAKGTGDESEPIEPDVDEGLNFLAKLRPTHVLCGNHEDRLWRLAHSHNAIVSYCAGKIVGAITDKCRRLKAQMIEYTGIHQRLEIGGYLYTHGTVFGEQATRDMAEMYGNVVHAHTHRAGVAKGRRSDNPTGFGVGTLSSIPAMEYAKARRATMAWSAGFVFGEYAADQSQLYLCEKNPALTEWRLP